MIEFSDLWKWFIGKENKIDNLKKERSEQVKIRIEELDKLKKLSNRCPIESYKYLEFHTRLGLDQQNEILVAGFSDMYRLSKEHIEDYKIYNEHLKQLNNRKKSDCKSLLMTLNKDIYYLQSKNK